jgi:ribosomal protein S8E
MTKKKFSGVKGFLHFEIDDSNLKSLGIARKSLLGWMKYALEAMARHWHRVYLPKHFEEAAYERYRYGKRKGMDKTGIRERAIKNLNDAFRMSQGRSGAVTPEKIEAEVQRVYNRTYTRRKERQFKHNRPLNFTGAGMLEALGSPKIRGSSKQVRVVLPSKFNFKHPDSRINMRDEITRVLNDEVADLLKVGRVAIRDAITANN